ncbi:MAG: thermonuclease family protein [Candidatus Omnitrophica bacterium]|nr:thermonuclease family protein [Candidatus Omnitrophota bacterium]MBU0896155.1 thermonuclease family protein [Candidatus Omnitrophota bacterium]MBU1133974.1 thermonuclease family protein [Candidatus Omnitrophota bacterium]MBU1367153.1 thermonuclease family protein [Candidatus Omnitrophota bacterium]MBU1523770.1 thermonuclease family protein [Candidatus Omnitrophota bacterium]
MVNLSIKRNCLFKKVRRLSFCLLFFLACSSPQEKSRYLNNYSQIRVIDVIDGDTIVLENNRHLRLIGMDTPEIRKKEAGKFIYQPQAFSREAKQFVEKLVKGKMVRVEFDLEKEDKYSRLLGYCFLKKEAGEVFLNKKLLREGLAVLYTFPPNVRYVEEFLKAQKEARKDKRGLWGAYEIIAPGEARNFIGQIRTVRGKVLSTYDSGKAVFLNFGQNYKSDFTIVIFKNSLVYFNQIGIKPNIFYKGKTIEVSGRIREYNGPEIIANSPYEIEVLDEPR